MGMDYSVETAGAAGLALGIIVVVLAAYLLALGMSIAMYILQSLGIYTIAQRRGIKHPWMAWLPVANQWILGSISDQYQYVTRGKIRSRRKVMLGLSIAVLVLGLVFFCVYAFQLVNMFLQIPDLEYMSEEQIRSATLRPMLWLLGVDIAMFVVAVVLTVFQYICLHNLYASCDPKNKTLYTVLSVLLNVTLPFFVFICRKKDLGMPPRKKAPAPEQLQESAQPHDEV